MSRRDRLIVARHEVPGIDVKRLRPGGTVEVIVSPSVSRIGSIVPLDGAIFLMIPGTSGLATIVLSLRDKTNRHRSASHYLRAPWVNPGLDPPVTSGRRTIPNSPYLRAIQRVSTLNFVHNSKKRRLQPGSAPTSSISAQTGWKPILHYAVASSRWVQEGAFRCTRIIARHSREQCRIG